ncbi:TetR/AcrR family transcriptional regulator [Roseicyclus sp. F158]|uniref:TetR/AcrR family transcriptional regulator n=1 Tax=Tropicimonas omnivorans TaxID=3075590 RepID=A0ABU3DEU3_9RHOB|nr:TetR/AcrR family transcriptional regulator [Roseicyclus sp. F158]MDT0682200.1 TetR/AcrR family transcriptional regulator [Roseicyclus sp. F158]
MARTRASDFEEKQRILLKEAAHVFASQGMDKASMSQIAKEAGVSKSLLYHYYPSKDALIFAIILDHLERMEATLASLTDHGEAPKARLRMLIGTTLEVYRGADDEHKVQLNAGQALTDAQQAQIRALERRIVAHFSAVILQINPDLVTPERSLLMPVTMSLFGMMNWVYMWFREGGAITRDEYADVATTLILEGVKAVR